MTRERFSRLVEEALREIPRRFRDEMKNVAVVVEDEPSPDLLKEMEVEPDDAPDSEPPEPAPSESVPPESA